MILAERLAIHYVRGGLPSFHVMKVDGRAGLQLCRGAYRTTVCVDDHGFAHFRELNFGAMLVTSKGRAKGTRELRRNASGEIALCIGALVCDGNVPHPKTGVFLIGIRYRDSTEKTLTQWYLYRMFEWP